MKKIFISLLALSLLAGCKKEEASNESTGSSNSTSGGGESGFDNYDFTAVDFEKVIDYISLDAQTVTDDITVKDATKIAGTPPAPSNDSEAPVLYDDYETDPLINFQGNDVRNYIPVQEGNVAGIYMKVPGSDSYFDIPAKIGSSKKSTQSSRKGKKNNLEFRSDDSDIFFEIELPDDLKGEFCINYCIYDSAGLVSNVISQCFIIETIGGNLPLNKENWTKTSYIDVLDEETGDKDIFIVNKEYFIKDTLVECQDSLTGDVNSIYEIVEYLYLETGGSLDLNNDGSYRLVDSWTSGGNNNYYCGAVDFQEDYEEIDEGHWTYDEASGLLTFIDIETSYPEYTAQLEKNGDQIMLIFDEYYGFTFE